MTGGAYQREHFHTNVSGSPTGASANLWCHVYFLFVMLCCRQYDMAGTLNWVSFSEGLCLCQSVALCDSELSKIFDINFNLVFF